MGSQPSDCWWPFLIFSRDLCVCICITTHFTTPKGAYTLESLFNSIIFFNWPEYTYNFKVSYKRFCVKSLHGRSMGQVYLNMIRARTMSMSRVREAISSGNDTSLLLAARRTSRHCSWQMNGGIVDSWFRLQQRKRIIHGCRTSMSIYIT